MPPVEQELHTFPEHMSSPSVVFIFLRSVMSIVLFLFSHYIVCHSSNYDFWLLLLRYTDFDCPFGIFKLFSFVLFVLCHL